MRDISLVWLFVIVPAADSSVPHLAKMKTACFTQINNYRACLEKHGNGPDEEIQAKCGDALKALWECTDANKPAGA